MRVTYCIFCFNQDKFIKDSILGALKQESNSLDILVVDDCSTDNSWDIILEVLSNYNGPHNITKIKNEYNYGLAKNFSNVFYNIADGDYFIGIGGDDISYPNHVSKALQYASYHKDFITIDFNGEIIDQHGVHKKFILLDKKKYEYTLLDKINNNSIKTFAPGRIVNRNKIIKYFPEFNEDCQTEDSVLVLRSLLLGKLYRINEVLVKYRRHDNNLSSKVELSKLNYAKILSQYISDLNHAYSIHLVDSDTYIDLLKILIKNYYQSKAKNLNNKIFRFIYRNTFIIQFIYGK
jgi:glycosyltransferase involved in cell wall biosynthesis